MTLTVPSIEGQYSLRTPAHRFLQGGREVYSFTLNLATLDGLLPDRVEEEIVKDANRRLTPRHAKNIQQYLLNEPSKWVLGAMLLGIAPDALEFVPYTDENDESTESIGELRIISERKNTMRIFDGQHRRRAIADALTDLQGDVGRASDLLALQNASLPVVLYAENDIGELRQMFADASKTKPIESNTVTRFDARDAFNLAAMWLSENSNLFAGRVEMERTTVRRTSEYLITINQLSKALKTLAVGYSGRVSRELNNEHMLGLEALQMRCQSWADEFLVDARGEYSDLVSGNSHNSDIPMLRLTTFAFNASIFRIFAGCYYEWGKFSNDWKALTEFIHDASLTPGEGEGSLLVDAGVVIAGGTTPIPRAQEMSRAINYIVEQASNNV